MKRSEIMQYVPLDSTKTHCINTNLNFSFVVDTADMPLVAGHTWGNLEGYVSNGKLGRLHRYLTNAPADKVVDHHNHNKLDNTRGNLRVCTTMENARNRHRNRSNKSGYKGVSWHQKTKKWQVFITVDGRDKFLGCYEDKETAAHAYDEEAIREFGAFAHVNFPQAVPA